MLIERNKIVQSSQPKVTTIVSDALPQQPEMLTTLALLTIGYSVFASVQIAISHFGSDSYRDHRLSQFMGLLLLSALSGLQLGHLGLLQFGWPTVVHPLYQSLLFAVAPAFYLFSTPLLRARSLPVPVVVVHALPVLVAPFLPVAVARPGAFLLGAAYLVALALAVHALRHERDGSRRELALLAVVFAIAIVVTVLALGWPQLPESWFFALYSIAIGVALLLVSLALARAPQLPTEVSEMAQQAYARSTLSQVDTEAVVARLEALMREQKLYRDPDLNLKDLAAQAGLSGHQLSELVNSRLGMGVSRYIRDFRVAEAQQLLREKPSLSVLAISLEVGFSSQSSFYTAFRESLGMTPGKYREIHVRR